MSRERVLHQHTILAPAEQDTERRPVVRVTQQIVDGGEVEIELPGVLRLKGGELEVDDHVAAQAYMVKEEIEVEILAANLQVVLAAEEGEADAEFEHEGA